MLCPICKRNDVSIKGYGAQAICESCDRRALKADGGEPYTNSDYDEGDNPVFVDGHKCWRRYRFGGWIAFFDEWDCDTLEAFYKAMQRK